MRVLDRGAICYSGGVGEDISFDVALIDRLKAQVFAFDPTPASARFVARASTPPEFHFEPVAIWREDTAIDLYPPAVDGHVSHSISPHGTARPIRVPATSVASAMARLAHNTLDVLKIDIEGAEYDVLDGVNRDQVFPTVICVEFHPVPRGRLRRTVSLLQGSGYVPVSREGPNVTFMRSAQ